MLLIHNIGHLLTMGGNQGLGTVRDAALIVDTDGRISWAGSRDDLPAHDARLKKINAGGGLVMPGIVDPHTHLVFGNTGYPRAADFANRWNREPGYKAKGIYETINATRRTKRRDLKGSAVRHLSAMADLGVTTVEIKSGYSLTRDGEIEILKIINRLSQLRDPTLPRIVSTLLACHIVPKEYEGRRDDYVDMVCRELIPMAAELGLARFCDVWIDELPMTFTPSDARKVALAAERHGIPLKLHVDQTSGKLAGAELAASLKAVSADHLDHASDAGIRAMKEAGVVGVLLPYADLFTRSPAPNARRFLDQGMRVALSSDFNPGSSYLYDPWMIAFLGGALCNMKFDEALRGITVEAAAALALDHNQGGVGRLQPGYLGDALIIDVPSPEVLLYEWRNVPLRALIREGRVVKRFSSI